MNVQRKRIYPPEDSCKCLLIDLTNIPLKSYDEEINKRLKTDGAERHQRFRCKFGEEHCIFHPNKICLFRVEQSRNKLNFVHYSTEPGNLALRGIWTPRSQHPEGETGFSALNKQITKQLENIINEEMNRQKPVILEMISILKEEDRDIELILDLCIRETLENILNIFREKGVKKLMNSKLKVARDTFENICKAFDFLPHQDICKATIVEYMKHYEFDEADENNM